MLKFDKVSLRAKRPPHSKDSAARNLRQSSSGPTRSLAESNPGSKIVRQKAGGIRPDGFRQVLWRTSPPRQSSWRGSPNFMAARSVANRNDTLALKIIEDCLMSLFYLKLYALSLSLFISPYFSMTYGNIIWKTRTSGEIN